MAAIGEPTSVRDESAQQVQQDLGCPRLAPASSPTWNQDGNDADFHLLPGKLSFETGAFSWGTSMQGAASRRPHSQRIPRCTSEAWISRWVA